MTQPLAEVLFYHLEHKPLDEVLPSLVEKTLARGWRAVIQAVDLERVEAIDQLLWTFKDDSFIPHGSAKAGDIEHQPVFLTVGCDNPTAAPNAAPETANVRFMIDGSVLEPLDAQLKTYARVVYIFDGRNQHELATARVAWKAVKATGAVATYWQQSDSGGWQKKA